MISCLNKLVWAFYRSLLLKQQARFIKNNLLKRDVVANQKKIISDVLTIQENVVSVLEQTSQMAYERRDWVEYLRRWAFAVYHFLPFADSRRRKALQAAEVCRINGNKDLARCIICAYAPPKNYVDSYLALASIETDDPSEWLKYVNLFIEENGISTIEFQPGTAPRNFTLFGKPAHHIKKSPLVSVIMAAFNAEKTIENAIRSILNQSWRNLELIVVDDCSTDSTAAVVQRLMEDDARIRLIKNSINVGTYVSRNFGMNLSEGEYITCHDADDFAHPDRIQLQVEDLVKNPAHIGNMCCSVRLFEDGRFEQNYWGSYTTHRCCVSLMVRKEPTHPIFGYWDGVRVSADVEYVERIRAVLGSTTIRIIPLPLIVQFRLKNSLTTSPLTVRVGANVTPIRRKYQQSYLTWHRTLNPNNCYLPFPQEQRKFEAPEEIITPFSSILQVFNERIIIE